MSGPVPLAFAAALGVLVANGVAFAQDFASPWSAAEPAAATLLEHALPSAAPGTSVEFLGARWLGIAGLETRAVAIASGWRSSRFAAGVSSTGDAELGWTSAALAAGAARASAGAAVRAVARRERARGADGARPGGLEAGAGAWLRPAPALRVWCSAPQMWVDGAGPPLARALVIGAEATGGDVSVWIARESVRLGLGDDLLASHLAGIGWSAAGLTVTLEARDRPLRGAVAIGAGAGPVEVAARVENHPLAGETTHLALRWRTR